MHLGLLHVIACLSASFLSIAESFAPLLCGRTAVPRLKDIQVVFTFLVTVSKAAVNILIEKVLGEHKFHFS